MIITTVAFPRNAFWALLFTMAHFAFYQFMSSTAFVNGALSFHRWMS